MIHINTVNINVQMPCDEPGPTSVLGDALLHAMAESLFAQQSEEELESEGEAQPPINPSRMNTACNNAQMPGWRFAGFCTRYAQTGWMHQAVQKKML